jgi:hypothetical protein
VRTYEPAIDRYVAYRLDPDAGGRLLRLHFDSNAPGTGTLKVRLPPEAGVLEGVWLDERPVEATLESVGADRYVGLESDWRPHVLQVRWRQ